MTDEVDYSLLHVAKDMLSLMDSTVIIGGMAVAVYGHDRSTQDLDLATALPKEDVMEKLASYCEFLECKKGDVQDPLPWAIHGKKDGVEFQILPAQAIHVDVQHGVMVAQGSLYFVSLEDLIHSKCYAGGHQDLCDVAILVMIHGDFRQLAVQYAQECGCLKQLNQWLSDSRLLSRYTHET
ncbi:MAG: hypothetical protein JKY80_04970 [Mariprofundaceae bacterium]|nr:hypothetical protein [Mariprofundaceae bacterium]